jgi:5'-deoxy-5'-methylthioadenosine phosphorylase
MRLGVIGGSGADFFPVGTDLDRVASDELPWGECSAPVKRWRQRGHQILFIERHGEKGNIAPHRVNYRANLHALKTLGADQVIALNAVGGINKAAAPGQLVLPDQLVDYTWGREHTYFDEQHAELQFIEFTAPYDSNIRQFLVKAALAEGLGLLAEATYGVTQGPRLETAAEIERLERDGCDIVGMTGMPEAALAKELGLPYASLCFVVNWAAGRAVGDIHAEIQQHLSAGIEAAASLVDRYLSIASPAGR